MLGLMLEKGFGWLRSLLVSIPLILILTAFFATVAVAGYGFDLTGRLVPWCKRQWARMLLRASFARLSVSGIEKLQLPQPYILCSNHLSYLDPPVLLAAFPFPPLFLAKSSLFDIPFLGWGMRRAGDVPIDRSDHRATARSLRKAAGRVRRGESLVVFPEGTRSPDGKLQPFHSGAFRLAIQAQVPIVPVVIRGTREILAPGTILIRGGRVQLTIADPIPTVGMTVVDKELLRARVRLAVQEMLSESGPASGAAPARGKRMGH